MKAYFHNNEGLIGFANSDKEFEQILKDSGYNFDPEKVTCKELTPTVFNYVWLDECRSNFKDTMLASIPLFAEDKKIAKIENAIATQNFDQDTIDTLNLAIDIINLSRTEKIEYNQYTHVQTALAIIS